jgi:hypothetical protein
MARFRTSAHVFFSNLHYGCEFGFSRLWARGLPAFRTWGTEADVMGTGAVSETAITTPSIIHDLLCSRTHRVPMAAAPTERAPASTRCSQLCDCLTLWMIGCKGRSGEQ